MALRILRPTSIGTYNGIGLAAGANKVVAADPGDPVSHDGDTTYLAANVAGAATQSFVITTVYPVGTVNSFTQHVRANSGNIGQPAEQPSSINGRTRKAGVESAGWTIVVGTSLGGSYADFSGNATRPGGGSWTGPDFDGVDIELIWVNVGDGFHDGGNFDPNNHYTSMWGELNFEPVPGAFVFGMDAFVGAAIAFSQMLQIAGEYFKRSAIKLTEAELLVAWRELREHPRTVYFDLGRR